MPNVPDWRCFKSRAFRPCVEWWSADLHWEFDASQVKTEVFMIPTTHWIEKDGSFVNSGRWSQWKDQVLPPQVQARHALRPP